MAIKLAPVLFIFMNWILPHYSGMVPCPDTILAHGLRCYIQNKAYRTEWLTLYSTDWLSLANHFLGTFKKIEGLLAPWSLGWGLPGLLGRQGLHGELTCFTAMLTRTELMEPSIRTFSFSFLLMVTGCNRSSLLLLKTQQHKSLCTIEEQNA